LKDVRSNPTAEEKWQAQKVADVGMFAADPLVAYDETKAPETPAPVEQVQAAPATPAPKKGGKVLRQSTGSGRGGQGGPSAQELIDYRNGQIDAKNLQAPMQAYPEGGVMRITGVMPQPRDNVGIDEIGASQMTPQQIERQVRPVAPPLVPPAVAAKQAAEVGGGRGVMGGPKVGDAGPSVTDQLAQMAQLEEQARQQKAREDLIANQQFMGDYADQQGKILRQSMDARREQAKQMLIRSGEKGRKVVDQLDMNEIAPEDDRKNFMAVGDRVFNTKTGRFVADASKRQVYKDGDYVEQPDGSVVRVGTGKGKPVAHSDGADGFKLFYADGTSEIVDRNSPEATKAKKEAQTQQASQDRLVQTSQRIASTINNLIASGDVEQASAGVLNRGSAILNKTLGVSTDTAAARSRIDAVRNQIISQIMADFQSLGVSSNKLLDTKRELEAHLSSVANFDYDRLDSKALKAELARYADEALRKARQQAAGLNGQTSGARSPGGYAW